MKSKFKFPKYYDKTKPSCGAMTLEWWKDWARCSDGFVEHYPYKQDEIKFIIRDNNKGKVLATLIKEV